MLNELKMNRKMKKDKKSNIIKERYGSRSRAFFWNSTSKNTTQSKKDFLIRHFVVGWSR